MAFLMIFWIGTTPLFLDGGIDELSSFFLVDFNFYFFSFAPGLTLLLIHGRGMMYIITHIHILRQLTKLALKHLLCYG